MWAVLVLAALLFLYLVRAILPPFLIAFLISVILEPLIQRLHKRGWSRISAVATVFGAFLAFVIAAGVLLAPIVGAQAVNMRDRFVGLANEFSKSNPNDNFFVSWNPAAQAADADQPNRFDRFLAPYRPQLEQVGLPTRSRDYFKQYIEPRRGEIVKSIQRFFTGFVGSASVLVPHLFLLAFVPLIAFAMMSDMDRFTRQAAQLIPPRIREGSVAMVKDIGTVLTNYLRGVTTAVLGYMAVMAIVLTLLGAPYSIPLAVIVGAVYLLPYVNGIISTLVIFFATGLSDRSSGLFIHLSSSWVFAFMIAAVFLVAHLIYDSVVFPRLVGASVGLHPVVSMFVILSCGALFGLVGMIIAFPLAGSVKVILDRLLSITLKNPETLNLPDVPLRHRGRSPA